MDDMDIIEINEAFSAQSLACIRAWGLEDNDKRINFQVRRSSFFIFYKSFLIF